MTERKVIQLDADGDWIKRGTWDLLDITDAESLDRWLAHTGTHPEDFKRLDVYKGNVDNMPWLAAWGAD